MTDKFVPEGTHRLHCSFGHGVSKLWNTEAKLGKNNLCYPIFVTEEDGIKFEIKSLPGQYRWGVDRLDELLEPLVAKGLASVLVFGVLAEGTEKDNRGSFATNEKSPVARALKHIRAKYPQLYIVADVCICAYTSHGHCGLLKEDMTLDNQPSIERMGELAVAYATWGAHCVAPSDMMDGRIGAMKLALRKAGFDGSVSVMSYAAKFASVYYGPFRDAAGSGAKFGDRSNYQLPPFSRSLAIRAMERDQAEGADFIMVKPGGPYLDVVRDAKNLMTVPIAIYQVSGEYAMLYHGAKAGAFGLEEAVIESLGCMRRAGAEILITYFAPLVLDALN